MSNTPLTDALIAETVPHWNPQKFIDHARGLERRLSAAEKEIARRDKAARPMTLCQKHLHLGLMVTNPAPHAAASYPITYCPHCETNGAPT